MFLAQTITVFANLLLNFERFVCILCNSKTRSKKSYELVSHFIPVQKTVSEIGTMLLECIPDECDCNENVF